MPVVHGRDGTIGGMTKLLEHAIEKVRGLPEEDQDTLGAVSEPMRWSSAPTRFSSAIVIVW